MGIDLFLLPYWRDANFSHTILDCDRNYEVFDRVRARHQIPVKDDFCSFLSRGKDGEHRYGKTLTTPYGERLTFCLAKDLKICGFTGPIGAYIDAMEDNHRVALYWH